MKLLLAALATVAVVAYLATRRRSIAGQKGPVAGPSPVAWREDDDGVQADDYPWLVLARGAE